MRADQGALILSVTPRHSAMAAFVGVAEQAKRQTLGIGVLAMADETQRNDPVKEFSTSCSAYGIARNPECRDPAIFEGTGNG